MAIKIVRPWPLSKYVKFNMTTGEKLKAAWVGGWDAVPWIMGAFTGITVACVVTGLFSFCEETTGRRKYSKNITNRTTHDLSLYPPQAALIRKQYEIEKK